VTGTNEKAKLRKQDQNSKERLPRRSPSRGHSGKKVGATSATVAYRGRKKEKLGREKNKPGVRNWKKTNETNGGGKNGHTIFSDRYRNLI